MNSKILLVYEEYSDMMSVQTVLQKVGFDVLGISTEYTLSENILSFNPDVVVASGRAGKVTTLGVGRRLREMTRWQGKGVLILPAGYKPNPQDFGKIRADMLLEAPVVPTRLLQVIAKLLGHDEATIMERLAKADAPKGDELPEGTVGQFDTDNLSDEEAMRIIGGAATREELQFLTGGGDLSPAAPTVPNSSMPLDLPKPKTGKETDLESLWKELTEKNEIHNPAATPTAANPQGSSKKISFDLEERAKELNEHEMQALVKSITEARQNEHERVARYNRITDQIENFNPRQSLSKIASRKVQKDIAKSWNQSEIEGQDDLRREFTKALFRKK